MTASGEQMNTGGEWSAWIGRSETVRERIGADRAASLAATLGVDGIPAPRGELPPGWHWIFFNPFVGRGGLGHDGHPKRGGFLPPIPLPRRMWAGGRLRYLAPVPIGAEAERTSEIVRIEAKSGKRGHLLFVTLRHTIAAEGADRIVEDQDIVYREAAPSGTPAPSPEPVALNMVSTEEVVPDPVLLFRYSALTANGHRIHYDRPYATREEGYRDLVVHGPLLATLLQGLAGRVEPERRMTAFSFRAIAPVFVDRPFRIGAEAVTGGENMSLWVLGSDGEAAMQATAAFAEREGTQRRRETVEQRP